MLFILDIMIIMMTKKRFQVVSLSSDSCLVYADTHPETAFVCDSWCCVYYVYYACHVGPLYCSHIDLLSVCLP